MNNTYENPPEVRVQAPWLADDHPGYPARLAGLWNGWAVPLVTREVAEQVVRDQATMLTEMDEPSRGETDVLEWDGDVLVCRSGPDHDDEWVQREEATHVVDGVPLYDIGFGWTWFVEEKPGKPTLGQTAARTWLREYAEPEFDSYGHRVEEDGSHLFPVLVTLEPPPEGGMLTRHAVGYIRVKPDGTREVVR